MSAKCQTRTLCSVRRVGVSHEAFAVHPGSFRRYHLDRIPSIGPVPKRTVNFCSSEHVTISIHQSDSRALEPAEAQRTAAAGIAGSQRWNNAWPTCAGLAGTADPVRTRLRHNHLRQLDLEGAKRLARKSSGSFAIFAAIRRAYVIQPSRFARVNSYCTIVWMRHSIN